MSYSYTEKKRIRKNFGTFAKVMDLPNLVETQINSYSDFLQADVAPEARKKQGLEEVFKSLFPIKSVSGNAALEYVSYELGKDKYDVQECLIQGLSYSAPLRIKVELVLYDRDSNFKEEKRRERNSTNLGLNGAIYINFNKIFWHKTVENNCTNYNVTSDIEIETIIKRMGGGRREFAWSKRPSK